MISSNDSKHNDVFWSMISGTGTKRGACVSFKHRQSASLPSRASGMKLIGVLFARVACIGHVPIVHLGHEDSHRNQKDALRPNIFSMVHNIGQPIAPCLATSTQ
eukprot:scaffold69343_cov21-Prasinocladus_malaysianus.AAC.1